MALLALHHGNASAITIIPPTIKLTYPKSHSETGKINGLLPIKPLFQIPFIAKNHFTGFPLKCESKKLAAGTPYIAVG